MTDGGKRRVECPHMTVNEHDNKLHTLEIGLEQPLHSTCSFIAHDQRRAAISSDTDLGHGDPYRARA